MDLIVDAAMQKLVDAIRESDLAAAPEASGWEVFDGLGITEMLVPTPDGPAALGQLAWCLVLEELGGSCRDHSLIRSVRTFLDVYPHGPQPKRAAEAFGQWVGAHRAGLSPQTVLIEHSPAAGPRVWRTPSSVPALGELPDVVLDPSAVEAVADRQLLAVAAYALGIARRCLRAAQERADGRTIAGRRLLEYQGTSHRLAQCAVDLAVARAGLRRTATGEDDGKPAAHRAPAAAAASVTAALDCAHTAVQIFGAAGTSNPEIIRLFRAAYALPALTGAPAELWRSAGIRRMQNGSR